MLVVAFVLTLNNFFYAINPAAAKPIFDWIDPFAVVALALVFMEKILGSMRGETEWPLLVVTVLVGALVHLYAYNYLAKMAVPSINSIRRRNPGILGVPATTLAGCTEGRPVDDEAR